MDTVAIKTAPPHAPLAATQQQNAIQQQQQTLPAKSPKNNADFYTKTSVGAFFQTCKVSCFWFFFLIFFWLFVMLAVKKLWKFG